MVSETPSRRFVTIYDGDRGVAEGHGRCPSIDAIICDAMRKYGVAPRIVSRVVRGGAPNRRRAW